MPSIVLVLFGFTVLVAQTALSTLVPMYAFAPNLMLPIAIYLGVSAEVHLVRGALISFLLGYMLDSFCGNPMGLQTFVMTASFMVARGAGLRLFPAGPVFQVFLTFLVTLAFGATVLALRAIFEQPSAPVLGDTDADASLLRSAARAALDNGSTLVRSAAATALIGPLIFAGTRRIEAIGSVKREERTLAN
jgi:rod shape-determining protein MreD